MKTPTYTACCGRRIVLGEYNPGSRSASVFRIVAECIRYVSAVDDPKAALVYAKRLLPTFEPSRFLTAAIEEAKAEADHA